jgi:RHS repeat-associated protein
VLPASQKNAQSDTTRQPEKSFTVSPPSINLPKGGGAIRGIGEKFTANPVTGTGSMAVPIATSPGRSGFGPQLNLSYDSGSGNGPFGFGWSLSLPSITRKTDKGLPQYRDAEESDIFILSGAEDLVPVLVKSGAQWVREKIPPRTVHGKTYLIQRYQPRIDGLFARIERWTNQKDLTDSFWRSISKDNVTTWYGKTPNSRIYDPVDPSRIFSWLICESYGDKGNVITYGYKEEDSANVERAQAHEANRTEASRSANRYIKKIRYGNLSPGYFPTLSSGGAPTPLPSKWMFETVFDYGEHDLTAPTPLPKQPQNWDCRVDPFSSYRAGFEIRTYRLCQRVLMFHHFPGEKDVGQDCLVRSTDFTYSYKKNSQDARNPIFSFLLSVTQSGYKRQDARYLKKSLPPLEFQYTQAIIQNEVREVDTDSLENLPVGLDGTDYQWVDLDGEGSSGILTEQADGWYYKRNLSANHQVIEDGQERTVAQLGPMEVVTRKPANGLVGGGQFLDLAGDGQVDLVEMEGAVCGFYERTNDASWETFRAFTSWPNVDTRDSNLKFVDVTGDGHTDILITEGDVLTWYPSLAEDGFGPAVRSRLTLDEEKGPRLVFADGSQSIYLADFSGDGLSELVRIRNGEVCYWPNLGYGRFGAKVTMDDAPWFDAPDQFDQRRIRLADVDGSGLTDILYLGQEEVKIYFNQSGNSWASAQTILFPKVDNIVTVQAIDLLGNGTACLVWSSPLPGDGHCTMRYVDLMGGQKPHLLIKIRNNLGAETDVSYVASTKYYLQDKLAGHPWITRLPFPVHCVEKLTVRDKWRGTSFATTYSYHHGYFDGPEREFRGFGRVEQVDIESFGKFAEGNKDSPFITDHKTLYQPPVKTVTWFHTGIATDRTRILSSYAEEYFPNWLEAQDPETRNVLGSFQENILPEPDLIADELSAQEWREAMRACKGMTLRQEIYELDVDALERGEEKPVRLFSTAYHNCHIQRLQPCEQNKHAVFLVTESEAITYHYELELRSETLTPDPRITHTLNLAIDKYGNVLQSVAVVYRRIGQFVDPTLPLAELTRIRNVQKEPHHVYTENRYTDNIDNADNHRLRLPYEVLTYELTGIGPEDKNDRSSPDPRDNLYFTLDELRAYRLSTVYQKGGMFVDDLSYHELPDRAKPQKRLVEHTRTLFFNDDLSGHLPLGKLSRLGLPYEQYKLALTNDLITAIFGTKLNNVITASIGKALDQLNSPKTSGYLSGSLLAKLFGSPSPGEYWIRSGTAGFASDAPQHFYLPERYTDPFDNVTTLAYDDKYNLFVKSSTDPRGNTTEVTEFDYRVLAPREINDLNGNLTEACFDSLGMLVAVALKGKGKEADNLNGFDDALTNPTTAELNSFFNGANFDEAETYRWLRNATIRYVYHFGETIDGRRNIVWEGHPAGSCTIQRERHVAQLNGAQSPLQVAFECSDGLGAVLMKKIQAEPVPRGSKLRWIVNGKIVLNNKGKPVKQYEPYFSNKGHRCEEPQEVGVTPVMYYDAVGRLVRTELPDGTISRVEFSPWQVVNFDANDTVLESAWYEARKRGSLASPEEKRAAKQAAEHANTPAVTILDSLGRDIITIAHNRIKDPSGQPRDEKYITFTKLDTEGKPLWIRDARGNLVMQYINPRVLNDKKTDPTSGFVPCYDIAGNLLFQHSMDAGDRWMLADAAGKPILVWDANEFQGSGNASSVQNRLFFTQYDELHRPVATWLSINRAAAQVVERFDYVDAKDNNANAKRHNLLGQVVQHYDPSGLTQTIDRDFKGNIKEVHRQLTNQYNAPLIDWQSSPQTKLESDIFVQITEYDALNRVSRQYNWHRGVGSRVAVFEPSYNQRGLLVGETLLVRATKTASGHESGAQPKVIITEIRYNPKGQKEWLKLGNGTITRYEYDPETFRLIQLRTSRPNYNPSFPDSHSGLQDVRILQQLNYTYDPTGNITEIYDEAYEPVYFQNQKVKPYSRYEYDALYRLIKATGRENGTARGAPPQFEAPSFKLNFSVTKPGALRTYTEEYEYDSVGNIQQMRHRAGSIGSWTRYYQYAKDSNRLTRTWEGDPNWGNSNAIHKITYNSDTHGNTLNLDKITPDHNLRWDYRDMIQSLNLQGGGWAYYNYDANRQRTRKRLEKQGGTIEERLELRGYELYRKYNAQGSVEEIESHHLLEGEQRVLLVDDVLNTDNIHIATGPLYRYQYSNHLGLACVELDEQVRIISYEEYHPYGTSAYRAMTVNVEVPPQRYRYTGKERDEESGLNYHGARYYTPWLGRWISCDPSFLIDGFNIFSYCSGRPTMLSDTKGRNGGNAAFGTRIEGYFEEILRSLNIDYDPQSPYPRGNTRTDFDLINEFDVVVRSVDTKARNVRNYITDSGELDLDKITRQFQRDYAEALKHMTATGKSETLLYVVSGPENSPHVAEMIEFLKLLGTAQSGEPGPQPGVGAVDLKDLWSRVKEIRQSRREAALSLKNYSSRIQTEADPTGGRLITPIAEPDPIGGRLITPIAEPDPTGGRLITPIAEPDPTGGRLITPIAEPDPIGGRLITPIAEPDPIAGFVIKTMPLAQSYADPTRDVLIQSAASQASKDFWTGVAVAAGVVAVAIAVNFLFPPAAMRHAFGVP